MSAAPCLVRTLTFGALKGALVLGIGGRIVMRLLALSIDRPTEFSLGGTSEVVAYGSLLGLGGGLIRFFSQGLGKGKLGGIFVGLMTYGLAHGTLPDHIAETASPFSAQMWLVHTLFGATFLAFGILLSMATASSAFAKATYRD